MGTVGFILFATLACTGLLSYGIVEILKEIEELEKLINKKMNSH